MRIERDLYKALAPYIIEAALPLVLARLSSRPIRLDFSDRRGRILGFYRGEIRRLFQRKAERIENRETISLQISLNPYALLLIFIHEWAHLLTHLDYPQARPHGKEWRRLYRREAQDFLRPDIFPADLLEALNAYFTKPGAYWDERLASACAPYGKDRQAFERIYKRSVRQGRPLPAPVTYRLAFGRAGKKTDKPVSAPKASVANASAAAPVAEAVVKPVPVPTAKPAEVPVAPGIKPAVAPTATPAEGSIVSVQAGTLTLPARVRIQNRWARLEKRQGDYLSGSWEDNAKAMRVHVGAEVGVTATVRRTSVGLPAAGAAEKAGQPQSLDE